MNPDQEIKIHNLLMKSDANGVCNLARMIWDLKDYFTPWIYDNYWEFRLHIEEKTNNFSAVISVYPTAETKPNQVLIALNAENLEHRYKKQAKECSDFIYRLQYMLGKPELPKKLIEKGWDYLLVSTKEETYLFVKEFCFFAGY